MGLRASLLGTLAPHLSPELLERAFEAAQSLQEEDSRAGALGALAPHLSSELLERAFEAAQSLQDKFSRAGALGALAPYLPEPIRQEAVQQAFEAVQAMQGESNQAVALRDLAPHLPEPVRQEALRQAVEAAQTLQAEYDGAWTLDVLAHHLPPELLELAFAAAQTIQDERSRVRVLAGLTSQVDPQSQIQLVEEVITLSEASLRKDMQTILNILFSLNHQATFPQAFRRDCLRKLIQQAARLNRDEFLMVLRQMYALACSTLPETEHGPLADAIARAILDVGEWWP